MVRNLQSETAVVGRSKRWVPVGCEDRLGINAAGAVS